jgi:hypothetical protein
MAIDLDGVVDASLAVQAALARIDRPRRSWENTDLFIVSNRVDSLLPLWPESRNPDLCFAP